MKRFFVLAFLVLVAATKAVQAQGLDDQYFAIFNLIQEADNLSSTEPAKAVGKYVQAQTALQRFQRGNPDWNPQVVTYRLSYIAQQLATLSSSAPPPQPGPVETNKVPQGTMPPGFTEGGTNAPGDLQWQVNALKEQVKQMLSDRALLEAKLKEALAAQPAETDPRELARAEEKIKALQKENELLKVTVEGQKSKSAAMDPRTVEQTQAALVEANRQLAQQKDLSSKLSAEKEALQARLKSSPDFAALQAENDLLKKQILGASTNAPATKPDASSQQISQAQAQIAKLQSDKELLRLEKSALEARIKQLSAGSVTSSANDDSRVRQLERERDDLKKKLDAATKAGSAKKGKATAARVQELEFQLSTARARLEVLEARQVPYTPDELALLKQPQAVLDDPKANVARTSQMPAGAAKLLTEAQSFYGSRQFEKAEAAYTELLKQDPRNVFCLANLAAIQSESGKLDAAENNLKLALAESPNDVFTLQTLGLTKFRQSKYDDSFDALSRAAVLDPQNAEIQNYLGLALSEKGMRGPAEAAFRKAIQLQPNYAQAHFNLAVSYATQKPPAVELGRFHYQKAVALGQPRNPDLEQRFQSK